MILWVLVPEDEVQPSTCIEYTSPRQTLSGWHVSCLCVCVATAVLVSLWKNSMQDNYTSLHFEQVPFKGTKSAMLLAVHGREKLLTINGSHKVDYPPDSERVLQRPCPRPKMASISFLGFVGNIQKRARLCFVGCDLMLSLLTAACSLHGPLVLLRLQPHPIFIIQ